MTRLRKQAYGESDLARLNRPSGQRLEPRQQLEIGVGGAGDALIDFVGGGLITTIQDGLGQLNGARASIASGNATTSNSALTGPLTIAASGGLHMQAGATVTTRALTVAANVSVAGINIGK